MHITRLDNTVLLLPIFTKPNVRKSKQTNPIFRSASIEIIEWLSPKYVRLDQIGLLYWIIDYYTTQMCN